MWTVGLTREINVRFRDRLVWTVGLTGEINVRFRDGLVWTVGLTGEIKLCFQILLVWCGGSLIHRARKTLFQFCTPVCFILIIPTVPRT